jgi:lipopolysaccharide transport system permease protein
VNGIYTVDWFIRFSFWYTPCLPATIVDQQLMPLSQYIRLMDVMARMALRADASRFFLGYIWWVLEPLLWVGVFYIVFVVILGTRQSDFLPFLMVGKLAFVWFSKSVTQASNSIITGRGLVGKINVPKTLFPMAIVQESLYRQAAVFLLMFAFLLVTGYQITTTWFYLLPLMVVNYLMVISCALVGACLVCIARDFGPLIGLGMMFLMFTSGIFWDVRELSDPKKIELILTANPLAFILDGYRQILMYETPPDMLPLLTIGAGFGALYCLMVLFMRRNSQYLALKALTA